MEKDPDKLKERTVWNFLEMVRLNPTPQFIQPAMELAMNKTQFGGRAVESMRDKALANRRYRYNERTSETMRLAGEALNVSPKADGSPVQGIFWHQRACFCWIWWILPHGRRKARLPPRVV